MLSGITFLLAALALLLVLFALGVPILIAFLICDIAGILLLTGTRGYTLLANSLYETATTTALVTIPLFLLIGEILLRGKAVEILFQSIDALLGRVRGRHYVLTVALSTLFGALSGTAMGVAAMLGRALLPHAAKHGYDQRLACGLILAGASLAPIIPPSVLVIIIGTLSGVSIAGLLVAGLLPGLVLASLFLVYVGLRVRREPALVPHAAAAATPAPRRRRALLAIAPLALVVASIMGLILSGIATPSEAAATGVAGALLAVALYRELSVRLLRESLLSAMGTAAMILVIMASSKLFSQLLAMTGGTTALTRLVTGLEAPAWIMLVMMMALPFVLCMFIDQIALMLVIIPIYKPLVAQLGFDPMWFWLLFLINITVGGMTPPFGYTIFALKGATPGIALEELFRAAWPFVGLFLIGLVILAVFPGIVTLIPSLL